MQIDRRTLLVFTALAVTGLKAEAADDEHALFWRLTNPGTASSVLFGYARVTALLVPDIVRDGNGFVDQARRAIQDFHPRVKIPALQLARKDSAPVIGMVGQPVADELRGIFARLPQIAAMIETLSGIEVTALLMGEGQTYAVPSAAGVIADHARAANVPSTILLGDDELQALWTPPDLVALNKSIDEAKLKYLLDLRRRVGPIGAHLEQLYFARRGEEISRFTGDLRQHGVVSMATFMPEDRIRPLLLGRLQ